MKAPGWLFCLAVVAAWLLGAELAVFTDVAKRLPDRLPGLAAWTTVVISVAFLAVIGRRQVANGRQTTRLITQLKDALSSFGLLTETSLGSLPLDDLLGQLLERLDEVLETDVAAILVTADGLEFAFRASHGLGPEEREALAVVSGQGLIGSVLASRLPEVIEEAGQMRLLTSQLHYQLGSAAACPLVVEDRLIGVCVVGASTARRFDGRRLQLLQLVADRAAVEIERAALGAAQQRSRLAAEHAGRRRLTLANASQVLLTAKDEFMEGLAALVGVVVPDFADWCRIELVESHSGWPFGRDGHGVIGHDHPAPAAMAVSDFPAVEMRARVLATGAPVLSADRRTIMVPIEVASSVFATMAMSNGPGREIYETTDVDAALELAGRAAIAVERVLRYQDAQAAVGAAQRRANQLHQLVRASIDVQQVRSGSEVLVRMAERTRQVFDAQVAAVTAQVDSDGPLQAVAQQHGATVVSRTTTEAGAVDLARQAVAMSANDHCRRPGDWLDAPINRRPAGGTVAVQAGQTALSSEDEAVLVLLAQMTSSALDSTELYSAIQSNEARWRVLVQAAPIGIIEVNLAGDVVWWNGAAMSLFSWPDADRGLSFEHSPSFPANIGPTLRSFWSEVMGGSQVVDRELRATAVEGELWDLLVSAAPLRSGDGKIHGILTLVADVADRRRLEAELRRAQRMEAVGQLAGGVAHDFNNLLTLIHGYTELLERHLEGDRRSVELVDGIRAAAARAALLTGQLLAISQRQSAPHVVLDPAAVLRSAAEVLQRVLGASVDLSWALDPEAGRVCIDPAQLEQVVLNLATNARDAMPEGGRLAIAVAPGDVDLHRSIELGIVPGRYVCLSMTDTGTGMDTETLRRCFDPMFTTKGPSHGTGIGLSAVRDVAEQSGGAVHVESRLGEGATFVVYLPAADGASSAAMSLSPSGAESPPAELAPPTPNGQALGTTAPPRTVLVAEDDDALRKLMTRVLRRAGYRVLEASDGYDALVRAERWSETLDAMISDVAMPGMTGPALAAALITSRPTLRVLFVSGGTEGSEVAVMPPNGLPLLAKPFQPSQLLARLGELLDT